MNLKKPLIAGVLAGSALLGHSALALPLYSITDLGTLGGLTKP